MNNNIYLLCAFLLMATTSWAQVTDSIPEEEDFSQYAEMQLIDNTATAYCTQKVPGQSPSRLISIGYEYQHSFDIKPETGTAQGLSYSRASTPRIEVNVPIFSKYTGILNAGGYYFETGYTENAHNSLDIEPLNAALAAGTKLRSLALNLTYFKPLSNKVFLLAQAQGEYNGSWTLNDLSPLSVARYSATAIYGRKPHDRRMWGLGVTRTYRGGELLYVPVFLYNYTHSSMRWGAEVLLPARADVRYNFSVQNMVRLGYELEGSSYHLPGLYGNSDATLRRSEIKLRALWDVPIKGFYRVQAGAGVRVMYRYALDDRYIDRLTQGDAPYLQTFNVGAAPFAQISINLVSP
jgi:hypothetical protein